MKDLKQNIIIKYLYTKISLQVDKHEQGIVQSAWDSPKPVPPCQNEEIKRRAQQVTTVL